MPAEDTAIARIAAAIGEPARARMLYSLLDGHARTGTELAAAADVGTATTSAHLARLVKEGLVRVQAQGRHRYFQLTGPHVARVLESLSVLAGGTCPKFVPNTPSRLRSARTCYDHMAGSVSVAIHDRLLARGFLEECSIGYELSASGEHVLRELGVNVDAARQARRKFAYGCLDWSERRHHLGGALGAALLSFALERRWVAQDLDSRALSVTRMGQRNFGTHFDVQASEP